MVYGNDYEAAILDRQDARDIEDDNGYLHFYDEGAEARARRQKGKLTVEDIIESDLVNDKTMITIHGSRFKSGHWFEDVILESLEREINIFHWDSDGKIFIELKKEV